MYLTGVMIEAGVWSGSAPTPLICFQAHDLKRLTTLLGHEKNEIKTMERVTVLGGGISGLAVSYYVGHDNCVLYEADGHYGGHVYSETHDGCVWDDGPHGLIRRTNTSSSSSPTS